VEAAKAELLSEVVEKIVSSVSAVGLRWLCWVGWCAMGAEQVEVYTGVPHCSVIG
jgi:hypothetical protein